MKLRLHRSNVKGKVLIFSHCSVCLGLMAAFLLISPGCTPAQENSHVSSEDPSQFKQLLEGQQLIGATPTPVVVLMDPQVQQPAPIGQSQDSTRPLLANPILSTPQDFSQSVAKADNQNPLEFTFPDAEREPISLWRPPLYPTPWEPTPQDHFYFTRPIGANDINWPLSIYRYGYLIYSEPHTGIDIPAPKGTPIMAAGAGTINHAGYGIYMPNSPEKDPYGIAVSIRHDFGYHGQVLYTVYGHMNETYVYPGQHVEAGDVIGIVGETGNVSGPHLHFEVRLGDYRFFFTRNPELWISPPQGWGVLVGQVLEQNGRKIPQAKLKLVNQSTRKAYEVISYAEGISIRSDDYYDENVVLGDLPAGVYTLYLDYNGSIIRTEIEIRSGQITFFSYRSKKGFDFTRPVPKGGEFVPPENVLASAPDSVANTP